MNTEQASENIFMYINLLMLEKKVFWPYYAVDFKLANGHRVGIKYVCTCSSSV